jgi:peroxiredoxin
MLHLIGMTFPDVELPTSRNSSLNLSMQTGRSVIFCYPYTGRPNVPNPPNWDNISGAHGSTPQALQYAKFSSEFEKLAIKVFGLSLLPQEWIVDFAHRHNLPYLLLSDHQKNITNHLNLPQFEVGDTNYLQRITLIVGNGAVQTILFPVSAPEQDAANALAFFS